MKFLRLNRPVEFSRAVRWTSETRVFIEAGAVVVSIGDPAPEPVDLRYNTDREYQLYLTDVGLVWSQGTAYLTGEMGRLEVPYMVALP